MALRSTLADDPSMAELLADYVEALAGHVARLKELVAAGDGAGARKLLHQLKGSGKSYGFAAITEAAKAAEALLASGAGLDAALPAIRSLVATIESVEGYRAQ
jgi:HPt (histidine-containing phosphotransfer) domain-containing protein